ncbi:hypothetical protein FRC15_011126 [Serendipita sp. 397]|nr:hypothetical protein FRC15_011126 [Serendipita sp. 397]
MSPVPNGSNDGQGVNHWGLGITGNINIFLQLITFAQLLHFVVPSLQKRIIGKRRWTTTNEPSLILGVCTLCALIAYVLRLRPLEGDLHFLTLTSRTPHPIAEEKEDTNPLYGWMYDCALVCIFASAFMQLQRLSRTSDDRGKASALGDVRAGGRHALTGSQRRHSVWVPEWVVVTIGLAGAVALAGMRSPLLEVFLGRDFDKNWQLSGSSTVIAFLLVLWRFVTFLDIINTVYSLGEATEKDTVVLALWQRASLPMAAELTFDILCILLYDSLTFKTFSRDEVGHATAGIQVFDSPVAIALSALSIALAKLLKERHDSSSSSTLTNNTTSSSLLTSIARSPSPLPLSPLRQ